MMCTMIGARPIRIIGFGRNSVISLSRVPKPPHKINIGNSAIFKCLLPSQPSGRSLILTVELLNNPCLYGERFTWVDLRSTDPVDRMERNKDTPTRINWPLGEGLEPERDNQAY